MRRPLLLTAAVALLCAGCSTNDGSSADGSPAGAGDGDRRAGASASPDPGSAVRAAVEAVGEESVRIDEEIELAAEGEEYGLTVTGDFDFAADRGRLTVGLPGGAISRSDEIFAEGRIYISGVAGIDEGAWGVMPRNEAEAHYALRAPLNDPEHVLRQISAMRQTTEEGEETVRGVRTTHYRGTIDHDTLTLRMAGDVRAKTDQARDMLGSDLPVFADAWVDGQGRLVRVRMDLNMSGTRVTVTMGLSDFGKPVKVTVPKASDTVAVSSATGVLNG
ncbi:LppX_LprAFG lipoprotein [Streptomyces sp. NPDC003362]